jgi:hypothetical protein
MKKGAGCCQPAPETSVDQKLRLNVTAQLRGMAGANVVEPALVDQSLFDV